MQSIYLEVDEEITSAIDKIRKAGDAQVVLIFPKGAAITRSLVSLKLLKKEADNLGKNIIFSSPDEAGYKLAQKIGIKIANVDKNGQVDLIHGDQKNSSISKQNKKTEIDLAKDKKTKKEKRFVEKGRVSLFPKKFILKILLPIAILAAAIFYLFNYALPSVEIKIIPKAKSQNYEFEIVADEKVDKLDLEKSIMPGKIETKELTFKKSFDVAGEKEIGDKAQGEIIVYNKYSSKAQNFPKETKLKSGDKIFVALLEFEVPGAKIEGGKTVAGSAKVKVEAEHGGDDYNLKPSTFLILSLPAEKQKDIWGESLTDFSGGTSKKIKALSDDDLKKAREAMAQEAGKTVFEEIKNSLSQDLIAIDGTYKSEVMESKSDAKVDQEATQFEMEAKIRVKIMLLNKNQLEDIIFSYIENKIDKEEVVVDKNLDEGIIYEIKSFDDKIGKLIVKIKAQKLIGQKINEEMLKKQLLGLNKEKAEEILQENPRIKEAKLYFWPVWIEKIPKNKKKIKISLDTKPFIDYN